MDIFEYIDRVKANFDKQPEPRYNTKKYFTDNVDDIGPGLNNRGKIPRLNVMPDVKIKERGTGIMVDPRGFQDGKIPVLTQELNEGGVATPKRGLVDEPGSYSQKSQKPLSVKETKKIKETLPDGVSIYTDVDKNGKRRVILKAQVGKGNKLFFSKSKTNFTKDQINDLIKEHAAARKKYYPNELSDADFKKLRFDKKYINMSDMEFADALNKLEKTTRNQGKPFSRSTVRMLQKKLGITHEVGRQTGQKVGHTTQKLLTPDQKKKIINTFPEIKEWNFRSVKDPGAPLYGVGPSQVGTDKYDLIRKVSRNDLAWPIGRTLDDKLWQNAYRSAIAGKGENRFRILHPETNKIMSRSEIVEHNWVRDYRKAKFLDTKTNKRFTYNTFEKWMNNHAVPGEIDLNRYNNAKAKYKLSTDLKNVKIIQGGKEVTFGNILANKFRRGKERFFSGLHNHHRFNIADNFWDTEVVFFKDNKGIRNFEPKARDALRKAVDLPKNQQTKFLKEFSDRFKKMGPIRITEGDLTLGSYDPKKMITNVARQANISDKETKKLAQGLSKILECKLADGVNCDDPMSYYKSLKEQEQIAAEGKGPNKLKAINKVKAAKNFIYGTLGPYALALEAAIAAPIAGYEFSQGALPSEILNTATYGIAGKDRDEIIQEQSGKDIFKARDFLGTAEKLDALRKDPISGGFRGRYDRIEALEDTSKELRDQYYDPYFAHPKTGNFSDSIFQLRQKQQADAEAKYQEQRDQLKKERADKYTDTLSGLELFSSGGIASGPPPEKGPQSQGLAYLMKNGKR